MTCPGGCIGGGGQPRLTSDAVREARIRAIYAEDEGRELRKSHENPDVMALYEEWLGEPLGTSPTSCCTPSTPRRTGSSSVSRL